MALPFVDVFGGMADPRLRRRPQPGDPDFDPNEMYGQNSARLGFANEPYDQNAPLPWSNQQAPMGDLKAAPFLPQAEPRWNDLPSTMLMQDPPPLYLRNNKAAAYAMDPNKGSLDSLMRLTGQSAAANALAGTPAGLGAPVEEQTPVSDWVKGLMKTPAAAPVGGPIPAMMNPLLPSRRRSSEFGPPAILEALKAAEPQPFMGPMQQSPFMGPEQQANPIAQAQAVARTYRGLSPFGESVRNYDANQNLIGGNYRGSPFSGAAGEAKAIADWHAAQGLRETGIAGAPSVESIMNNQIFGTIFPGADGGMNEKRLAAQRIQQGLLPATARLEEQRIQNEHQNETHTYGKIIESANYARQRVLDTDGTPEQGQEAYDSVMKSNYINLPKRVQQQMDAAGAGPTAAQKSPFTKIADSRGTVGLVNSAMSSKFDPTTKQHVPLTSKEFTTERMNALAEAVAQAPDEAAKLRAIDTAIKLAGGNQQEFEKALVKAGAGHWSMLGLPVQYPDITKTWGGAAPRATSDLGLPFDLVQNNRPAGESWGTLSRGFNTLFGKPEALYNQAVTRTGTIVPIEEGDLYGGSARSNATEVDKAKAKANAIALKLMLEELYKRQGK